ncbi:MAG TPA: cytochrome c biogenesis protein CcsA [Planctomycetota bacterium]|nr:cytochrome c biogenesis protein CcsA [Planctomycetota bacterium]HRR83087.1 cytochrome c biogenesis protein CcsA [Planctomycetota bacterium]HRT96994.1 cytochrome c biogenesis protein CcsA [Planctomycetota bacterium]
MTSVQLAVLQCATAFYAVHAFVRVRGMIGRGRAWRRLQWGSLAAALVLHTWFLAARGLASGGLPIDTRLDSVALFSWVAGAVFGLCERPARLQGMGTVFWAAFVLGLGVMWAAAGSEPMSRGSLARFWLALHLVPVYLGYGGFAVAAAAGATYLVQERLLHHPSRAALWRRLPPLESLERLDRTALTLGFPALTVGLVAGVLWARQATAPLGHAWYADPKVVGGLVVWLFYAAVLHVRLRARWRGRRAAWLTILGFLLTLVSFATVHVYTSSDVTPEDPAQAAADRGAS